MTRRMITTSPAIVLSQESFKDIRRGIHDFDEALYLARGSDKSWQVRRVADGVTLAQSRTDAPGTMAALYAAGKMTGKPGEVKS
jgi:hypothetical protein